MQVLRGKAMNKKISLIRIASFLFAFAVLLSLNVSAAPQRTTSAKTEEKPFETYTYWQDLGASEKTMVYCKPMYKVKTVINANVLNIPSFGSINDITADNGKIYILDSTNSTVYVLEGDYSLYKKIDTVTYNGERLSFDGASGIFVKNEQIYIADTKNARILALDTNGNVTAYLTMPESKLIPDNFNYSPIRVAVDSRDYIYIVSEGSYYGALVYSPKMEFLGFYGANSVPASVGEILTEFVTKLFSTNEKRAASVRALPYQFTDFAIGPNDFIYTVTSTNESAVKGQVKKLNPGGRDVLTKSDYNFADDSAKLIKTENLNSIDVDSDGFFYALDSGVYNRIFWYDKECNLMCVFGGGTNSQTQKGTFSKADTLAINGTDIVVSDSVNKNITVFSITDYGKAVRKAQTATLNDNYSETAEEWKEIIKLDKNNQLAYRGLAKAYYSSGDYDKALEYAKLGADKETYADAFGKERTRFFEKNFTFVFLLVIFIAALLTVLIYIKRKKKIVLIKNAKLKNMLECIPHPFESFRLVKEKGLGSLPLATAVLAVYYIISAISDKASGFAFNRFDAENYNSFYVLLKTVALVMLFVSANWLVCVLMGGIGKFKEIYIVTCYSLLPIVFAQIIYLLMTHILSPDEFAFITIFKTVCILYTFFILAVGVMKVHNYEFGKFVGTTVVTAIAMIIIVFLIFMVCLLAQQVYGWIATVFTEIRYR